MEKDRYGSALAWLRVSHARKHLFSLSLSWWVGRWVVGWFGGQWTRPLAHQLTSSPVHQFKKTLIPDRPCDPV